MKWLADFMEWEYKDGTLYAVIHGPVPRREMRRPLHDRNHWAEVEEQIRERGLEARYVYTLAIITNEDVGGWVVSMKSGDNPGLVLFHDTFDKVANIVFATLEQRIEALRRVLDV